jgi:large subunit ribosomal protein L4
MTSVDVVDATGAKSSTVELPAEIFDVTVNVPLIHQVVVAQLAAARQGTHSTKTRGEVAGGGRKPYRQKGTGRARQGSIRAPQFAGGGVVHGPTPRTYEQRTPKRMKAAALRGALSDRARNGRVHVVSGFVDGDTPSTRAAVETLANVVDDRRNVLVVLDRNDMAAWKSLRNVSDVHLLVPDQLNTYDVLVSDHVVFTTAALDRFLGGITLVPVEEPPAPAPAASTTRKTSSTKPSSTKPSSTKASSSKTSSSKASSSKASGSKASGSKASSSKASSSKSAAAEEKA